MSGSEDQRGEGVGTRALGQLIDKVFSAKVADVGGLALCFLLVAHPDVPALLKGAALVPLLLRMAVTAGEVADRGLTVFSRLRRHARQVFKRKRGSGH